MTYSEIRTFFHNLIKDSSLDTDFVYQLMDDALSEIENERDWYFLHKVDSSNSVTSANTYTTFISLPSDFGSMRKVVINKREYIPIPFEDREFYRDTSGYYYIDLQNSRMAFTGTFSSTQTVYIHYTMRSTTPTSSLGGSSPAIPARFHKLIGYTMAELIQGAVDGDEINFVMSPKMEKKKETIHNTMVMWDAKMRAQAMNYSVAYNSRARDLSINPDVFDGI